MQNSTQLGQEQPELCPAEIGSVEQGQHTKGSRRILLLQLALAATVAGPSSASDFFLPLDSSERLPPGISKLTAPQCTVPLYA